MKTDEEPRSNPKPNKIQSIEIQSQTKNQNLQSKILRDGNPDNTQPKPINKKLIENYRNILTNQKIRINHIIYIPCIV